MGLSWGKAQAAAKDRPLWRNVVVALCPTGDKEDKYILVICTSLKCDYVNTRDRQGWHH